MLVRPEQFMNPVKAAPGLQESVSVPQLSSCIEIRSRNTGGCTFWLTFYCGSERMFVVILFVSSFLTRMEILQLLIKQTPFLKNHCCFHTVFR